MKDVVKAFDNLPWIVKLILCLPVLNIAWGIYRICKGINEKNTLMLVIGILWIIPGSVLCWVIDFVSTIVWKKPVLLA